MPSIAGIDHTNARFYVLRNQVCRTGLGMPHHEHVGIHCGKVVNRVEQRFALGGRGRVDVEIDDICRQAFGSDFKRGAGAG